MQNSYEQLPNVSSYIALMHGPVLLGAKTGTEDLTGLIADDSRWGHIASGTMEPLNQAPVIVSDDRSTIGSLITPVAGKPLTFKANALFGNNDDTTLVLEPFYKIHDSRYMMYWMTLTSAQYQTVLDSLAAVQQAALDLEKRTIDKVAPGEQQPEVDHNLQSSNSYTGNYMNEFWRDARNGGYISYSMLTKGKSDLSLMVRYWGNETGSRSFYIQVDGTTIATENIVGKWNKSDFVNVEYPIPNNLTAGKDTITVKFQAINTSNYAGGLFYVRLLQPLNTAVTSVEKEKPFSVIVKKNHIQIGDLKSESKITLYDTAGRTLKTINTHSSTIDIPFQSRMIDIVKIISDGEEQVNKVLLN